MKEQHYIQVWIDGKKENLPEKDGEYIAHSKIYDQIGLWEFENYHNDNYPEYYKKIWLDNIDWYLAEVEQPKGLTDEEIEKEAYNYCAYQGQPDGEPEFDEKSYNDFIKGAEYARDQMQGNLREELIKAFDWLTDKESPYAILYGNITHRFATSAKDYNTEEVVKKYLKI